MADNETMPHSTAAFLQSLCEVPNISEKSSLLWKNPPGILETEPQKEDLGKFVNMVHSADKTSQLEGLICIRKLLSLKENPPIQDIVDSGVVPKLLEFMKWDDEIKFQYESAWAVTNICSGTSQDVEYVVNLGGLDVIISLLDSSSAEVLDQAVWALGNVAGDNSNYRNMCLERDSMDKLVNVLLKFPSNSSIKRNAVWAMSNLIRGKPIPEWPHIAKGIPVFKQIIADTFSGEALVDALWGISWTSETYIQEVIDLDCVPHLVNHLKNNQLSVLIPALRALGNIVTGNDSQTNTVLSCPDFLPRVFDLTTNPKKTVRKEACWLISNIAAGNDHQISLILNHANYIDALKKVLVHDAPEVVTEASWALGNLASGASHSQIAMMVNSYGYVNCLSMMLDNSNPKVQQIGLEAILNVLNSGEGKSGVNPYIVSMKGEGVPDKVLSIQNYGDGNLGHLTEEILGLFEGVGSVDLQDNNEEKQEDSAEGGNSEEEEDEDEEDDQEEDDESEKESEDNCDDAEERMYQNLERED